MRCDRPTPSRCGDAAGSDDARTHGALPRRPPAAAALRPRRLGSDLVGTSRRPQHHPARRSPKAQARGCTSTASWTVPTSTRARRVIATSAMVASSEVAFTALIGADGAGSALRAAMNALAPARRTQRVPRSCLQGTRNPARSRRRLPHRTERAAHLAARRATCASRCRTTRRPSRSRCSCPTQGDPSFDERAHRRRGARAVRARFRRRGAADPAAGAGLGAQSARPAGHAAPRSLAPRRSRGAARRRRARDGAVPRPGHELRVRGLRGAGATSSTTRAGFAEAFAAFEAERKPNARRDPAMALENYLEMRDRVDDPDFLLQRELERVLQERHPGRFVPHYTMVTFMRDSVRDRAGTQRDPARDPGRRHARAGVAGDQSTGRRSMPECCARLDALLDAA